MLLYGQAALERQDLSCMYLAHHELVLFIIIIIHNCYYQYYCYHYYGQGATQVFRT